MPTDSPLGFQQTICQRTNKSLERAAAQGLVEIGDQIVSVFQSDAGAHDAVAHPLPDAAFWPASGRLTASTYMSVG